MITPAYLNNLDTDLIDIFDMLGTGPWFEDVDSMYEI